MSELPPGERGPGEPQVLSVEDLKQNRANLEVRIEEAKRQKALDIKKQLGDREAMIAEDRRLVPMIQEAIGTLEYFETQQELGLLTESKDQEDLKSLKELVASLEKQRQDALEKYDAIMSNPQVSDEVLAEAHIEHRAKEFQDNLKEVQEVLEKSADAFYNQMENHVHKMVEARTRNDRAEQEWLKVAGEMRKIVEKARGSRVKSPEIWHALETFDQPGYLERLKEHRKQLGILAGHDKAIIDYVIVKNSQTVSESEEALSKFTQTEAEVKSVEQEVEVMAGAYRTLLLVARGKETELQAKFPDRGGISLVFLTDHRIEERMREFADLKRTIRQGDQVREVGKYDGWHKASSERKNAIMHYLKESLERKGGKYNL